MSDSALVKASLEYKNSDEGGEVTFGFNPSEYTVTASASWKQTPAKGKKGPPKSEFTGNLPRTLNMDVLFIDNWAGVETDVWGATEDLMLMTWPTDESVQKNKPSAPLLLFRWGDRIEFPACHLKQVTVKYTLFDDTGQPTRASASIQLEEVLEESIRQNPTSGGVSGNRAHVVAEGDSLPSIAFHEYDDAALWRGLADLNGIDDPLRLRVGQRLIVPPFEQAAARS